MVTVGPEPYVPQIKDRRQAALTWNSPSAGLADVDLSRERCDEWGGDGPAKAFCRGVSLGRVDWMEEAVKEYRVS